MIGIRIVPLRKWIDFEAGAFAGGVEQNVEGILRKTTIGYGIAEMLRHARDRQFTDPLDLSLGDQCRIDNFAVRVSASASAGQCPHSTFNDIKGIDMLSPQLSMNIVEPSFLSADFSDESDGPVQENQMRGRYLEVEFQTLPDVINSTSSAVSQSEEDVRCYSLGILLSELFSHQTHLQTGSFGGAATLEYKLKNDGRISQESAYKRARVMNSTAVIANNPRSSQAAEGEQGNPVSQLQNSYVSLIELGFPSSICLLVQNLLECGEGNRPDDAYDSLDTVIKDLHLMLLDPRRFLFDNVPLLENGRMQLSFRQHKLYGRESEVSLITDAFCRVSSGRSEAFFIGGFSGSGKSRLVNSLTARVDMAEGYVLTHKFDQMSKERPLLEVISVFNDLCLLIKEKRSKEALTAMVKDLIEVFGTDFSVLAQLLPNIEAISPQLDQANCQKDNGNQMNLRSVCFTLQRFMRVVSSSSHPVMLFLDDLQWCDKAALTVIQGILCDVTGSSCLFFVGSYRSNEVQSDHALFSLIDSLRFSDVPTTKLSLEGLNPTDLNAMVSDAMCMFPRICEPLSDIVFQKTKGNPFFVLEFLRSLVDGGLLEYSVRKRRWVWDEDCISSMDITGNVLCLLSSKMSGLFENTQLALKVAACFGIKIKESVIRYLSACPEYSNIRSWLDDVISEGFMIKVGNSDFKFVHDKVQEAAYSLIPDDEKKNYHYKLGMLLYSITKGNDVDDIIFPIADQINHGIDDLSKQNPGLWLDLAILNEMAGSKAVDCSDYVTAHSYFTISMSLLPPDHWKSQHSFSRRLYLSLAKSAYACSDVEKAQGILQEILGECCCIKDKLPAYYLLVIILNARGEGMNAYNTCKEVLFELGEIVPESVETKESTKMIESTSKMTQNISDADLMGMKEMDENLSTALKFYNLMATVAFFAKPKIFPFLACRMTQLTMEHGVCKDSMMGFVQYATMLSGKNTVKDVQDASRIGKAAMSCLKKRFGAADQLPQYHYMYYGHVAYHTEPFQACADMVRQGFDVGMSCGESGNAFINAIHHIKAALIAGEKLPPLLDRVDYYLDLANQYKHEVTKSYLSIFRETISTLIDKGVSTGSKSNHPKCTTTEKSLKARHTVVEHFQQGVRAFWLGYNERCHHCLGKWGEMKSNIGRMSDNYGIFIQGLNSFHVMKRHKTAKVRGIPKNAISALKAANSTSRWNFRNKVHLLEAENFSYQNDHEEAKASYAAAITSARCSRFIHEQGLACELAGYHYKKMNDLRSAWSFFNQAKQCYAEWGSQMKVDSVTRQMETFQISLASAGKGLR